MVANECMDEFRKRRRLIPLDFLRPASGAESDEDCCVVEMEDRRQEPLQEGRLAQLEVSEAVLAALTQLKPKLRMAILLKYFEDLSYEQIAEALGCSMGTVASRLNRGATSPQHRRTSGWRRSPRHACDAPDEMRSGARGSRPPLRLRPLLSIQESFAPPVSTAIR